MPPMPAKSPDKFPSGSWGIGVLNIQWNLKANNEVDVTVSVIGIQIDTLTLTLNSQNAEVKNDINILNIIKGAIGLKAVYDGKANNTNGLYIEGQLTGPEFDTGAMNYRIIAW